MSTTMILPTKDSVIIINNEDDDHDHDEFECKCERIFIKRNLDFFGVPFEPIIADIFDCCR